VTTPSELIAGVFASRLGGQPLDLVAALAATRSISTEVAAWANLRRLSLTATREAETLDWHPCGL